MRSATTTRAGITHDQGADRCLENGSLKPADPIGRCRHFNKTKEYEVSLPSIGTGVGKQVRSRQPHGRREPPLTQFGTGFLMRLLRILAAVRLALSLATDTPPRCRS